MSILFRIPRLLVATLLASILAAPPALAEITRLEILSKRPFGSFAPGDYEMLVTKVHGELSTQEKIPGLDKATKNARGRVEYSARIVLVIPVEPRRGNGTLLVDVPNRGNAYAFALYNSPRDEFLLSGSLEQGNGFMQEQGFSLAEIHWELGKGADLPTFVDGEGKTRYVEGVGFAIFRDATEFLARASADAAGNANPLAGAVRRTIATGKSQSARFLKTFLLHGFNMAGRNRVFDGMHLFVPGSGYLPILEPGTGPASSGDPIPTFENPDVRGITEEPLANDELVESIEARGEVMPKVMMLNSATDYHSRLASLSRTGSKGPADRPIPSSLRIYDIGSAGHVMGSRGAGCTLTPTRLDWNPVSRATLLRLNEWIAVGMEPPASRLMTLENAPADLPTLRGPAHLPAAVVQVPKRDADGNSIGGVRLPDVEVPLGTHGATNLPPNRGCMLVASYVPFTAASIAERYRDRDAYVNRIRRAARELVKEGFLLPEDAAIVIQAAASNPAFKPPAR